VRTITLHWLRCPHKLKAGSHIQACESPVSTRVLVAERSPNSQVGNVEDDFGTSQQELLPPPVVIWPKSVFQRSAHLLEGGLTTVGKVLIFKDARSSAWICLTASEVPALAGGWRSKLLVITNAVRKDVTHSRDQEFEFLTCVILPSAGSHNKRCFD